MCYKRILVAIDHSNQTPRVFEQALSQAQQSHAELLLLYSLRWNSYIQTASFLGIGTIADIDTYGALKRVQQEQLQHEIEIAQNWLRYFCQQAAAHGVAATFDCQVGDPCINICHAAQRWGADLIMIGRRGHQGLSEIVLGSVSNYVLHHAPCSVLVVQGTSANAPEMAASSNQTPRSLSNTQV